MNQERLCELAKKYSVTSTQDFSFEIAGANGPFVRDSGGKRYYDFHSMVGTANFGHNHPQIRKAVRCFVREYGVFHIAGNDYPHKWMVELMQKLRYVTPINFGKKVFLSNSGTEAVEAALKVVMDYHFRNDPKRTIVLVFRGAFHGRTLGALALNASKEVHRRGFFQSGPPLKIIHLSFPDINTDADPLAELKDVPLEKVAAIVFEIVQGEGGINTADPERMAALLNFLRSVGVLIVPDEIQTGMYRTGTLFACEQYGIEPDIICLGKSLGGGLPIGATVIEEGLDFQERGRHSNTFGGNPLICVAASQAIEVALNLNKTKLERNIRVLSEFAPEGLGMMRRKRFESVEARNAYMAKALEKGVLLIGSGEKNVRFMPPVNIENSLLSEAIDILRTCD